MDKIKIVHILEKSKTTLAKKFFIVKLGLFGSYASGENNQKSDIDIVYELEEGKVLGLKEVYELELFFKELFQKEKIDLVNYKYMNPIIENEMSKSVIYV